MPIKSAVKKNRKTCPMRPMGRETYKCAECKHPWHFRNRADIDYKFCPYCGRKVVSFTEYDMSRVKTEETAGEQKSKRSSET